MSETPVVPTATQPAAPPPARRTPVINLDEQRKIRAAAREGKRQALPIHFGGEDITTLPVELPLDTFTPLRALDADLSMVLRQIIAAYRSRGDERMNNVEMVVDILAANPDLPISVLNVIQEIAQTLLTDEGYTRLMAQRPTIDDIAYLGSAILDYYGVTLGESQAPSDSPSTAGTTSSATSSPTTTDSMPVESGATDTTPTSSESAAS